MIRSIKMLGLLVTAALAIGALSASAAQAEVTLTTGTTENEKGEVEHTGTQLEGTQVGTLEENYLELEESEARVSCENETVSYTGETETGTESELTLTPSYQHCYLLKNEGTEYGTPATVAMEGCVYRLTQPTPMEGQHTGLADLVCPGAGPLIKIYAAGTPTNPSLLICEQRIEPNQTELGHIVYTTTTHPSEPDDVSAHITIGGIKYENLKKTCPGGLGTKEDGVLKGEVTLQSTNGIDDVWLSTTE